MTESMAASERTGFEIAVIGMAGRFPNAVNINEFWENLKNGVESITFLSRDELLEAGESSVLIENPEFVKAKGAVLEDVEYFDASFFGYLPTEAGIMDPQIRIFHECAWEALEDAGYDPGSYGGSIGLYAGASSGFTWRCLTHIPGRANEPGQFETSIFTDREFLCTRVSYKLDLKGPAYLVQTACSTSLTVIHIACRALLGGECHMALAGGVSVTVRYVNGYLYQEGMVYSRDGHCRAFDAGAQGLVGGEGVGIVVLKPLEEAVADRDHIYAVVKGSAINNDGLRKIGYTAPSIEGQAEVIKAAQHMAETDPETITYIEAHGTGTVLGDPIEIEALKQAFDTDKKGFCGVGSVKTNIGHLDSASGVTGFIKTVLALKNRLIPPSLNYETPNPKIDFDNSPFYVNTTLREWKNSDSPLRAGVSSFGIGGANAHVVLEAWSMESGAWMGKYRDYQLILLSAKTKLALDKMQVNLAGYLKENPGIDLAEAAYTLQVGRGAFQHRSMLVCSTTTETIEALSTTDTVKVKTGQVKEEETPVIFMFSGLGSQYVNMGLELYQKESLFRREMNRCFEILDTLLDDNIKEILYPDEAAGPQKNRGRGLDSFDIAQLVTFIFGYALAKLLIKWGIKPYAMIGYSFGEYTAACISGVLALEDALKLVVLRGKLINKLPPGAMLSVPLTRDQLKPFFNLHHELSLAIDNGPSCIVAGPKDAVAAFEGKMKQNGCMCMWLQASRAIHSTMMEPILKEFEAGVAQAVLNEPQIPYISNVTGDWPTKKDAASPAYWAVHLRETVRFADGIKKLVQVPNAMFIEVGPGRDLTALITRHLEDNPGHRAVNIVRHPTQKVSDLSYLLKGIGRTWLLGAEIDWRAFHANEEMYRVPLPTYPFERQRFWVDEDPSTVGKKVPIEKSLFHKETNIANWFYIPSWEYSPLPPVTGGEMLPGNRSFIFLNNDIPLCARLVELLKQSGREVVTVGNGPAFVETGDFSYEINPGEAGDYDKLMARLYSAGKIPTDIVHLFGVTGAPEDRAMWVESIGKFRDSGFYSLLYLAKAIGKRDFGHDISITVVTDNMQQVNGDDPLYPAKSTVLGPVKVIPQEYPNINCRSIDIVLPGSGTPGEEKLTGQLLSEFGAVSQGPVVAYRGGRRWVQFFKQVRLENESTGMAKIKPGGVYLVSGGLGDVGYILAKHLAKTAKAGLILTGRSVLPPREEWREWLSSHPGQDPVSRKIRKVQTLEESGAAVAVFGADAGDLEQMRRAIAKGEERLGPLNGVIHAAGNTDRDTFLSIGNIEKEVCERQFLPKIHGIMVLGQLLQGKELDFCVSMSSIASVLGGIGYIAYSAANIFMDAFVGEYNRTAPVPWKSVNWDGWEPDEEDRQYVDKNNTGTTPSELKMTPTEGVKAFLRVLAWDDVNNVVHSVGDLQTRVDKWINLETLKEESAAGGGKGTLLNPRPDLDIPYAAPRTGLEKSLVDIWQKFFGYETVGIHDDFFQMGGDSLKAMTVAAHIHKKLNVKIPIARFFDAPTAAGIAEYIKKIKHTSNQEIEPAEEKEYYPLSFSQEGLYILQEMWGDTCVYNELALVSIGKDIEKEKLEEIFGVLIERHEGLRTSFPTVNGVPVQKVHKEVEFQVDFFHAGPDREAADEIIGRFKRPFDISKAPLLRVGLIETGKDDNILLIDFHHIVTDGLSARIFEREFYTLFRGEGEPLPELKLRYKDFSQWQNSRDRQDALKSNEAYWLNIFQGELPILDLPTDYPRTATQDFAGDSIRFEIGEELTARVKAFALETDTTLFMVLLAAYNTLLSKYTMREDILVGSPIAGRTHPDLSNVIGMFVNMLALRNYPRAGGTFGEFLGEVKKNVLNAYENQEYPFDSLVAKLNLESRVNRQPLVDTVFVFLNIDVYSQNNTGHRKMELEVKPYELKVTKYDLELGAGETGNKMWCDLSYRTKLFKRETIERMSRHFIKIIDEAVTHPGINLSDINMMSEEELEDLKENMRNDNSAVTIKEQGQNSPSKAAADFDF